MQAQCGSSYHDSQQQQRNPGKGDPLTQHSIKISLESFKAQRLFHTHRGAATVTTNLEHFITIKESLAHKWTCPSTLESPNLDGTLGTVVETDTFNYLTLRHNFIK